MSTGLSCLRFLTGRRTRLISAPVSRGLMSAWPLHAVSVWLLGWCVQGEIAVIDRENGMTSRSIPAIHALDGPCPPVRSSDPRPFRLLPAGC